MQKFPCPSCGADITFRTSLSAYAVCPFCHTMGVRTDDGLKNIGTMAALPDDMSPFQIGTEGTFKGVRFGVVGRMKIGYSDGWWNEWFIVSDDGRRGWLAEAQGFYAPCFELAERDESTEKTLQTLGRGDTAALMGKFFTIQGQKYKLVDAKEAECIGCEGELPFKAPQGRKTTTFDFIKGDGDFASIELTEEAPRIFTGSYVGWGALGCKFFREFEGW
jgi:hypothetical protein